MQKYLHVPFYFQAHFMPLVFKISLQLPVIYMLGVFFVSIGFSFSCLPGFQKANKVKQTGERKFVVLNIETGNMMG